MIDIVFIVLSFLAGIDRVQYRPVMPDGWEDRRPIPERYTNGEGIRPCRVCEPERTRNR